MLLQYKRKNSINPKKTPNIPHFTPIRADHTHKQGSSLLTYIKNNISFSQINRLNTFPHRITNHHNQPFYITAITYCKHVHSTQLSQTEEDSIIYSTFTTITNLPNTIITADVNAHSPLWYSLTEDHRED